MIDMEGRTFWEGLGTILFVCERCGASRRRGVWVVVSANLLLRPMNVTFKWDWLDDWLNYLCNIQVLLSERFILFYFNIFSSFIYLIYPFCLLTQNCLFKILVYVTCVSVKLMHTSVSLCLCTRVLVNMSMNVSFKNSLQHFNSHNKISDISQPLNVKHLEVETRLYFQMHHAENYQRILTHILRVLRFYV